jgi:hypothetical protein
MERLSASTKAIVLDLPATGSIVVVHDAVMRDNVERMIRELRGPEVLKATKVCAIRTYDTAESVLMGARVPVRIDHLYLHSNINTEVMTRVINLAHGVNSMFAQHTRP